MSPGWEILRAQVISLGVVLFLSLAVTWVILYYVRLLDHPNERSSHTLATPKCGGVGIVTSFLAGALIAHCWSHEWGLVNGMTTGLCVPLVLVALVSLIDDVRELPVLLRLVVQVLSAVLFLFLVGGYSIVARLKLPGLLGMGVGVAACVIWQVGMANLFNFMDGIDGIAAGEGLIVSFFFAIVQFVKGDHYLAYLALVLSVGCLGFLAFNFPPAKVFMGDVGSVSIGFILAGLAILSVERDPDFASAMVMPLLAANFIFDASLTLVKRAWKGENLFQAHRSHIYQRFAQSGFSQRTVSMTNYGMAIVQGMIVLSALNNPPLALVGVLMIQGLYLGLVCKLEARWRRQQF